MNIIQRGGGGGDLFRKFDRKSSFLWVFFEVSCLFRDMDAPVCFDLFRFSALSKLIIVPQILN